MKKKAKYRVRNWKDYNRSLERRGSLTFWMSDEVIEGWLESEKTGGRGASRRYSDAAILAAASVKAVFRQAGRQASGLLRSLFELMKLRLPVPDHSTVSRRMGKLEIELPLAKTRLARHVVVDSTGVKVYGEGEWKVRTHGASKRRIWRKLHLMVDEHTQEIVVGGASEHSVSDCEMFPEMIERAAAAGEKIEQVSGDGTYDRCKVYDAINRHSIRKAAIPPRRNAKIWQHGNSKAERLVRDENLRVIRKKGRKVWKQESAYHRRSLAETAMFRFKSIFTGRLQSRKKENQFSEMLLKCAALNRMTHLGMPASYKAVA